MTLHAFLAMVLIENAGYLGCSVNLRDFKQFRNMLCMKWVNSSSSVIAVHCKHVIQSRCYIIAEVTHKSHSLKKAVYSIASFVSYIYENGMVLYWVCTWHHSSWTRLCTRALVSNSRRFAMASSCRHSVAILAEAVILNAPHHLLMKWSCTAARWPHET